MTQGFYVLFLDPAGNTCYEVLKGRVSWQHVTQRFIDWDTKGERPWCCFTKYNYCPNSSVLYEDDMMKKDNGTMK